VILGCIYRWRDYSDRLGRELGVKKLDDWYNIKDKTILENGGEELLSNFGNSLRLALPSLYSEYNWEPSKFGKVHGYWREKINQRLFFDGLAGKLGLKDWQEWYSVKKADVNRFGSHITHLYSNSLGETLMNIYPEIPWDFWRFDHPLNR
jgi:hypothetical protein